MIQLTLLATEKKWYRPGLVFKAKRGSLGHQEVCRTYSARRAGDGTLIDDTRELLVEFAVHGGEVAYVNPNGEQDRVANIIAGFADIDSQAETKGWTDDELEVIARHMVRMAERGNENFELYSKAPVAKPWPKYDDAHHNSVAGLAEQLGLLAEALSYEVENKNRSSVVAQLRERLAAVQAEPAAEDLVAE